MLCASEGSVTCAQLHCTIVSPLSGSGSPVAELSNVVCTASQAGCSALLLAGGLTVVGRSALPELLEAAEETKQLGERLEKVTAKATTARVAAERAVQTADPEATLLVRTADRLDVDKKILEMKMQVASLDTKIAEKLQKVNRNHDDDMQLKALKMEHEAAQKAVEHYVLETKSKADLGVLSNEAAALERKVESSTSPVERAEAEARLAELEMHRQNMMKQAEYDEKIKTRFNHDRIRTNN